MEDDIVLKEDVDQAIIDDQRKLYGDEDDPEDTGNYSMIYDHY